MNSSEDSFLFQGTIWIYKRNCTTSWA